MRAVATVRRCGIGDDVPRVFTDSGPTFAGIGMQLNILKDGNLIRSMDLDIGQQYIVGRESDSDITLESRTVSRTHAKILVNSQQSVAITDLNSTNGIFIDGRKIDTHNWNDFDSIVQIGEFQLRLLLPAEKTEVSSSQEKSGFRNPTMEANEVTPGIEIRGNRTIIYTISVVLLVIPFIIVFVKHQSGMKSRLSVLAGKESYKVEQAWQRKKNQAIQQELAKAEKQAHDGNFRNAGEIIEGVLLRDPENQAALDLKKVLAEKKKIVKKDQEVEEKTISQELEKKQQQQKRVLTAEYFNRIELDKKNREYMNCLKDAQKILAIDPANERAVTVIEECSQALADQQEEFRISVAKQDRTRKDIERLQAEAEASIREKKYAAALKSLLIIQKMDPEEKYDLTQGIDKRIEAVKKKMSGIVRKYTRAAIREKKRGNYIKALHYYKLAYAEDRSDGKTKNRYYSQLEYNHNLAKELYHEGVAYASLDNIKEARLVFQRSLQLAAGNNKLTGKISQRLSELQKM